MIEIGLSVYFGYKISQLAKQKDKNSTLWVIFTLFCFFVGYMIGMAFIMMLFYNGVYEVTALTAFFANPLRMLFLYFSGTGGYLLIRYVLEQMPDKKIDKREAEE